VAGVARVFVYALEVLGVVRLDPDFKPQPIIEKLSTRLSNLDVEMAVDKENDSKPGEEDEPTTNNTEAFLVD
jgi:hypothetical protein